MKLLITINTGNAAFHPDPERDPDGNAGYTAAEIARILRKYIKQADEEIGVLECPLIDLNGNTVGRVEIEREAERDGAGMTAEEKEDEDYKLTKFPCTPTKAPRDLAEDAMNAAFRCIQDRLGVESGDLAAAWVVPAK